MNGQTLKIAFLMIVGSLCVMSMALTLGTAFKLIQFDTYVQLIGELGVGTLFGGICQAFIHANLSEASYVPAQPIVSSVPIVAPANATPVEVKA